MRECCAPLFQVFDLDNDDERSPSVRPCLCLHLVANSLVLLYWHAFKVLVELLLLAASVQLVFPDPRISSVPGPDEAIVNMKRELSLAPLPPSKRAHTYAESLLDVHQPQLAFDTLLFDEIILLILSHLSWTDLCAMQATNRNLSRLSLDNQVLT